MTDTTKADLHRILGAASAAKGTLAAQSPEERYRQLVTVADRLDEAADALVPVAIEESHLPEPRLRGELLRTTLQLRLFAEEARAGRYLDARIDAPDPEFGSGPRPDIRRMRRPIGVVLNFAASNFPFAFSVAGGDTASALAAGCPVVVKAHEGHPRLSRETARVVEAALLESGAPSGAFSVIFGRETGAAALRDDHVDAATFTGSVRAGLHLAAIAAARPRPIPFYGELGSINPVFVTRAAIDARGPAVAEGYVDSFTLGNGQFCTKPGLLFLPVGHGLDEVLAARAKAATTGLLLTESIAAGYQARLRDVVEHVGGRHIVESTVDGPPTPGLLAIDYPTFEHHRENVLAEVFGPFSIIVEYSGTDQLNTAAATLDGSLTVTLQAEEQDRAELADLLETVTEKAGRVIVNEWPTGVSVTPAQHHGGPFPSSTNPLYTAVGTAAMDRFLRPVAYQNLFESWLPEPLRDSNPWGIPQQRTPAGESQSWGHLPASKESS